jgi:hypothetical protein
MNRSRNLQLKAHVADSRGFDHSRNGSDSGFRSGFKTERLNRNLTFSSRVSLVRSNRLYREVTGTKSARSKEPPPILYDAIARNIRAFLITNANAN